MIETEQDVDRPDASTQADVTLVSRGITVTACVERSDEFGLVVRPSGTARTWEGVIKPGDAVEVYWVSGYEERTLPARVAAIEESERPGWQLQPTGQAERSQRRKAVRAAAELPVVMPWSGSLLRGLTIDISEGGIKALVDGWGLPPESGAALLVTLTLEDGISLDVHGEVVWTADRGTKQWVVAIRFTQVSDRDGDTLRRRVFRALREERTRTLS